MGYSSFSFTAVWAWISDHVDAAVRRSGNAPGGIVVELPEAKRAALAERVAPHLAELEDLRRQTLATVDRRARILVPLAGGAVLVGLLAGGHGLLPTIIFGLLAALAGWFVAVGSRASRYQAAVKQRFATIVSDYLSGFDHVVEPRTQLNQLRDWRLFPQLRSATTFDRITGRRDGRQFSLSEMSITYAPRRRDQSELRKLSVSAVEIASASFDGATLTLTPHDAPSRILEAQRKLADLPEIMTGDALFDGAYSLRSNTPDAGHLLDPTLRAAILDLNEAAPSGRPFLTFLPDRLVVLFPTTLRDLAFHVPPYWVPLDADALLAQFASDLALKNRLINTTLGLPVM